MSAIPAFRLSGAALDISSPQQRSERVALRRGIGLVLTNLVIPGSAQLQAGNRTIGRIALRVWIGLWATVALLGLLFLVARGLVLTLVTTGTVYLLAAPLVVLCTIAHALLVLDAWRLADPPTMARRPRLVFSLASFALAIVMVLTGVRVGSAAVAQGSMLNSVLAGGGNATAQDGRYNILLLGADAGAGRVGLRPDSITVASVDEKTGRTVLFSLPRNLEGARFAEGSPLRELYPNGYECADHSCLLNAVYTLAEEHKDRYPGVKEPGLVAIKEAVSGTLGLPINYTAMIDLSGFRNMIDAVGGIRLNIGHRVPIGGGTSKILGWIEPGTNVHLDGNHALWFARSREGSSDFDRMARQKCVMNAMLQQLDPITVVTKFNEIARAGSSIAYTDVPSTQVDTLSQLAMKAKKLPIASVSFTPPLIYPGNPKFDVLANTVTAKIAESEALDRGEKPAATAKATTTQTTSARPTSTGAPSTTASSAPRPGTSSHPSSQASTSAGAERSSNDLASICGVA